jgi:hypothetical protein
MLIRLVLHHFQGDKGVKIGLVLYALFIITCITLGK